MPKSKSTSGTSKIDPALMFLDVNRVYTLNALCAILGVEERTVREARSKGLVTKLFGGRRLLIRGADFDDWLKNHAETAPTPLPRNRKAESDD